MLKNLVSIPLFCFAARFALGSSASASDSWHVEARPRVLAQEIKFSNAGANLVGTVYLPETGDRLAAVVALHGASDPTRDQALYRHLAQGLPAIGIAVLIYDRRGSGASSGNRQRADYETLADDAIAGKRALAKLHRIDPAKIGFWGLSQGGWLSVLAAARDASSAFAISISAPLVTPEKQMEFATANLLTVRGCSREEVEHMLAARRAWLAYLRGSAPRATAVDALRQVETQPWFHLAFLPTASKLAAEPEQNAARKEMDYDPIPAVRSARVPLLFIYGGADPWVPVAESVKQLDGLSKQQKNIRFAVLGDANHEMMFQAKETMAFDAKATAENAPQAAAYFMLVSSWLTQHLGS